LFDVRILSVELKQPDPSVLILEAHIHANPKPKISWLCNGDFIKESERKYSKLEPRHGWHETIQNAFNQLNLI